MHTNLSHHSAFFLLFIMSSKKRVNSSYSAFQDVVEEKPFDLRFGQNFKIILSGASGTGKTVTCKRLLQHADQLMVKPPGMIYFFYSIWQHGYEDIKNSVRIPIKFIHGAPSDDTIDEIVSQPVKGCTIVLDDMQQHLSRSIVNLFQVQARHNQINLILLIQSLFDRTSPNLRDISLSATHFILTKSPRDQTQIFYLGRQMYPGRASELVKVFMDATSQPYTYLLIDYTQQCPGYLRLRSSIFPEEKPMKCWILEHEMQQAVEKTL